jgi:predicted amidohydrolase
MSTIIKTAIIQFTAGPDIDANVCVVTEYIRDAAKAGARLITTPENTCHIRGQMREKLSSVTDEVNARVMSHFQDLAHDLGVYILVGSLSVRARPDKLANRSYLFGPAGKVPVTYDKIHLFDADVGPCGYRESDVFVHGEKAVLTQVDDALVGMTICYDIRFPHLYRTLAKAGAQVITVPAAFACETGAAHWESLLRARAIENGVYIVAPAQTGTHEGGRSTHGHAMIVDPWGEIIVEIHPDESGYRMADLDMGLVARVRSQIKSLSHDCPFSLESSALS